MFSKRMLLAATALAYGLALGPAMAAERLSVMSFGGAYQEAQHKAVFGALALQYQSRDHGCYPQDGRNLGHGS